MSGLLKAFTFFSSSSIIGSLTQVAKGKIAAVYLGPSGVGIFTQLTTFFRLSETIAGLGFYNGIVRHSAESIRSDDSSGLEKHISSNLFCLLVTATFLVGMFSLLRTEISRYLFGDDGHYERYVVLVALAVPIAVAGQVYRALLSAARHVKALVIVRIIADTTSVAVFFILTKTYSLEGAVLGFAALHTVFLFLTFFAVKRQFSTRIALPRISTAQWREVRKNTGYGMTGLASTSMGIFSSLIIARLVIDQYGAAANGVVAVATKITTVYLGGLNSASGSYYYPQLVAADSNRDMCQHMNASLSLYFYLLPPIVALLMLGGDFMIAGIFSSDFTAASTLLFLMLPGDLFRTVRETLAMSFFARQKLRTAVICRSIQSITFVIITFLLLPNAGITGVAIAYASSQLIGAVAVAVLTMKHFQFRFSRQCTSSVVRGLALAVSCSVVLVSVPSHLVGRLGAGILLCSWFTLSMRDSDFAAIVNKILGRLAVRLYR
jgi:enterobacterial common antigen flippase